MKREDFNRLGPGSVVELIHPGTDSRWKFRQESDGYWTEIDSPREGNIGARTTSEYVWEAITTGRFGVSWSGALKQEPEGPSQQEVDEAITSIRNAHSSRDTGDAS